MAKIREPEKRHPSCYILDLKFNFFLERRNLLNLEETEAYLHSNLIYSKLEWTRNLGVLKSKLLILNELLEAEKG